MPVRAIEVPWTYHFEATESPVVTAGTPFFVDALDMVCGLAASIIKQARDYFGEFTVGRMRCIEPAYRFQFDKKGDGRYRYSYAGVALIEADFDSTKRKVQMSNVEHKFSLRLGTPPSAEDMLRRGLDDLRKQLLEARETVASVKENLAQYEADAAEFKRLVDEYLHRMAQFGVTPEPEQEVKAA